MDNATLHQIALQWLHQHTQHTELNDGSHPTAVAGVKIFYRRKPARFQPTLYEPGLVLLFSGAKRMLIGDQTFDYHSEQALLLNTLYPVSCHVYASAEEPLLGVHIRLDCSFVRQWLHEVKSLESRTVDHTVKPDEEVNHERGEIIGINTYAVNDAMREATWMLLRTLDDPVQAQMFGNERIRALLYAFMRNGARGMFEHWVQEDGAFAQFQKAVEYIQAHCTRVIALDELERHAGMSASSLNRAFKRYVADSPLQYIKKVRLGMARDLLAHEGYAVQTAALQVGYESSSQFSREFKRYFGYNPNQLKHSA